jgi:hypothetical protein
MWLRNQEKIQKVTSISVNTSVLSCKERKKIAPVKKQKKQVLIQMDENERKGLTDIRLGVHRSKVSKRARKLWREKKSKCKKRKHSSGNMEGIEQLKIRVCTLEENWLKVETKWKVEKFELMKQLEMHEQKNVLLKRGWEREHETVQQLVEELAKCEMVKHSETV